jgi:hypothetical protein
MSIPKIHLQVRCEGAAAAGVDAYAKLPQMIPQKYALGGIFI